MKLPHTGIMNNWKTHVQIMLNHRSNPASQYNSTVSRHYILQCFKPLLIAHCILSSVAGVTILDISLTAVINKMFLGFFCCRIDARMLVKQCVCSLAMYWPGICELV